MRSLVGLLWALGGAVVGLIIFMIGASIYAGITDMTSREGARGYFTIIIGLGGAVIGLIVGLVLYARSAPSGSGASFFSSGTLGFVGLVAAMALAFWGYKQSLESPLVYDGAFASLEMEFRVKSVDLPASASKDFLNVEVQATKTRPEGSVSWSSKRVESDYTIIPVSQDPLYRAGNRTIVVRVGDSQVEAFSPPMKRTPDPKADWSTWYPPVAVDPPYGVTPTSPLRPMLEMRYKIKKYGE
ncbi:MAG: hypothetical protein ABJC26_06360 [Gemmatimonadaceae bacterium]